MSSRIVRTSLVGSHFELGTRQSSRLAVKDRNSYYGGVPLDLNEFATKLLRCRTQLQLSVAEVAEATGLAVTKLEGFEAASVQPSGDDILVLADFFVCDYRFFISNERLAAFEQTDSLYRMHGGEFSKEDRRSILEFIFLCECEHQLEQDLDRRAESFEFTPRGTFFKGQGEAAAAALRAHFNYAPNAVPSDVYADFRKLGFHVFRRRLANSNISGLTIRHPSAGTCILVNYDEDIYRQRFTGAHEAAHGIIDRDQEFIVSFARESTRDHKVEIRANTFASRYILPQTLVEEIPVTEWSGAEAVHWANRLKVSTWALAIALKEGGRIDAETANRLRRTRVPADLKVDPELSGLEGRSLERKHELLKRGLSNFYVDLCFQALSKGIISAGRTAEMMLVDDFELGEIAALFGRRVQAE
jgi:Zn-dependent peptidase ImmA (M78 family)/transcriptional regulator with XRE-family HTH domain